MKKWSLVIVALLLFTCLGAQVWAASPIKLLVNGTAVDTDVSPQVNNGRVLVPIRWVAQALGANAVSYTHLGWISPRASELKTLWSLIPVPYLWFPTIVIF